MTQSDIARKQSGGRSPHQGRSATIIFHGDSIHLAVLKYTLSLLNQGITVVGFMIKGDYRMPVFVGTVDQKIWTQIEQEHREIHRYWTGIPASSNAPTRIYTLYLPLTVSALEQAIQLAEKGLNVVGFYADGDVVQPLTAGVMGPDDYDRLTGKVSE